MRLNRFDLNLLIGLDALLQERNVSRAAEHVFISQSAMSGVLRKLRDYFNDSLLVRAGRDFQLTARGLALVQPVRESLLAMQAVLGVQASFDATSAQRDYAMMIPDFVVPWLVPGVLRSLTRTAPGVRLQLLNWSSFGPARLVHGDIDFFVTFDGPHFLGSGSRPNSLCRAELQTVRFLCAVSADHPIAHDVLTREQFLTLPHIYVRMPGDLMPVDQLIRRQLRVSLDVRATTENVLEVPFMVRGTSLLAIVPECLGLQLADCLSIRLLEIPPGILARQRINLLWHPRNEPDPGHAWMRSVILKVARDLAVRAHQCEQPAPFGYPVAQHNARR
jgi:LysR family transcriptional regulator, nod-box dependent transcriptional activator